MSSLTEKIKKARKERRLTQREVADKLKISERMYQRYEKDTEPTFDTIDKLNQIFGIDLLDKTPAPAGDAMNRERALLKVLVREVAKLKANSTGVALDEVLKELEQNTTLELNDLEGK